MPSADYNSEYLNPTPSPRAMNPTHSGAPTGQGVPDRGGSERGSTPVNDAGQGCLDAAVSTWLCSMSNGA